MAFGFSFSHKTKDINNAWKNLGTTATGEFDAGTDITNEGLGDLRDQRQTYTEALKNPLGVGPNSAAAIFARARGGLSDDATRATNTLAARLGQKARQSGGNLSPAAQAELEAENERSTNQDLFEGNVAVSNAEASATLSETSKLFDRLDNISKTILGVGSDERMQGLQALIAALSGRQNLALGKAAAANAAVGTAISAASLGVSGSKGSTGGQAPLGGG